MDICTSWKSYLTVLPANYPYSILLASTIRAASCFNQPLNSRASATMLVISLGCCMLSSVTAHGRTMYLQPFGVIVNYCRACNPISYSKNFYQ